MAKISHEFQIIKYGHIGIKWNGFRQVAYTAAHFNGFFHYIETGNLGSTIGGRHVTCQDAHRGSFSGAVGAQESDHLALVGLEG